MSRAQLIVLLALVSSALVSRVACAEERAELLAEAAFAEGVRLMHADRCADAIVQFQKSQRLDPASGTALDLAYCQARLGRVASSWLSYRQALALAEAQGKPEHARIARTEAEKLDPELPRLSLVVQKGGGPPPSIQLDAEPLPPETWSVPIPVDPGTHEVAVVVDGARVWRAEVTMERGQHATLEIPPPKLGDTSAGSTRPASAVAPILPHASGGQGSPSRSTVARSTGDAQRTWALVLGSLGAATLVTGVALFASARIEYDGVGQHCIGNACDDYGYSARQSAASRGKASFFVLAGGGVLLASSVVLWLTAARSSSASIGLGAIRSGGALSLRGTF